MITTGDFTKLEYAKLNGLVPAVIQHAETGVVLMLGFMNAEALEQTRSGGEVVFFSRSKNRLWRKGETSGNVLRVQEIVGDCDNDALLIRAVPAGPVCHNGTETCFEGQTVLPEQTLTTLAKTIHERKVNMPEGSYTSKLFTAGSARIGQKVGEEGVEVAISAQYDDNKRTTEEAADLLYHLLVLLEHKGISIADVFTALKGRMK